MQTTVHIGAQGAQGTMDLKTWPEFFDGLWDGTKTAELRDFSDRGMEPERGDVLVLREFIPRTTSRDTPGMYTGRFVRVTVTRVDTLASLPPSHSGGHAFGRYVLVSFAFIDRGLSPMVGYDDFRAQGLTIPHPCAPFTPPTACWDREAARRALVEFVKNTRDGVTQVVESRFDGILARL